MEYAYIVVTSWKAYLLFKDPRKAVDTWLRLTLSYPGLLSPLASETERQKAGRWLEGNMEQPLTSAHSHFSLIRLKFVEEL